MPHNDLEGAEVFEFDGIAVEDQGDEFEDEVDVQAVVTRMIEEAVAHYDDNLEPDQIEATDYYWGRPFGDEKEGRSQVVSTDVRDATLQQIPSIIRIFTGSDHTIEVKPDGPDDVEQARVQTQYAQYVIMEDNPGFQVLDSAFKDALVRRIGIVKWWWEEDDRVQGAEFTGLLEPQLLAFLNDEEEVEDVELLDVYMGPTGQQTYDAMVTWRRRGRIKVSAVPNEEFIFTPDAKDLDSAGLVAHVREVPADELIGMGIDADLVYEHAGAHLKTDSDDLEASRQYHEGDASATRRSESDAVDRSQEPVVFAEAYGVVDVDGDGVGELRLFECIGPQFEITNGDGLGEIVDDVPFAVFTPILEPHTIVGLSNWDLLKEVQRVKSQIERGALNSLAKAIDPPLEVVNNEVNMRDVLRPEVSGLIRVRRPGMLREVSTQFVGNEAMSTLEYWNNKKADRTGSTRAAEGLDPTSLQSSTSEAVSNTFDRSKEMREYIARTFAETGMKRVVQGVLRLAVEHQDFARVVPVGESFITADPRHWNANKSVTVSIGMYSERERMAALQSVYAAQRELQAEGSPLVSNIEIRNTLRRFTELAGFKNSGEFFRPWGPEEEQQLQQQMAEQPPSPPLEEMLLQIEQMKLQIEQVKMQQETQLDQWKAQMEDDRERDKLARESALKERELELKFAADIRDAELRAQVERDRAAMDADVQREQARAQPTTDGGSV